jgi:hypothetical protein
MGGCGQVFEVDDADPSHPPPFDQWLPPGKSHIAETQADDWGDMPNAHSFVSDDITTQQYKNSSLRILQADLLSAVVGSLVISLPSYTKRLVGH